MMWLTWRQFRSSALPVFGILAVVAAALVLNAPRLFREYTDTVTDCQGSCGPVFDTFFEPRLGVYFGVNLLVAAVPIVVGLFWGVPLISREFETGTQELVWQQSVPRRRWLAVKLGVVGLAAIAAAALAVFPVSWWSRPLDATAFTGITRLSPALFDVRGYAALGHNKRDLNGIDSHNGTIRGLLVDTAPRDAWILSSETVDSAGRVVDSLPAWVADCDTPNEPAGEVVQDQCLERLNAEGYRQAVTYHPADRFWAFQAYETVLFGMLSLLLVAFCFWRLRPG